MNNTVMYTYEQTSLYNSVSSSLVYVLLTSGVMEYDNSVFRALRNTANISHVIQVLFSPHLSGHLIYFVSSCLGFFFIAVKRHHDHGNSYKENI